MKATNSSQSVPALTVSVPPLQASISKEFPLVSTLITVPANPLSLINTFEPPPRISNGSPELSAALTAAINSSSVFARIIFAAGPPTPSVVNFANSLPAISQGYLRGDNISVLPLNL